MVPSRSIFVVEFICASIAFGKRNGCHERKVTPARNDARIGLKRVWYSVSFLRWKRLREERDTEREKKRRDTNAPPPFQRPARRDILNLRRRKSSSVSGRPYEGLRDREEIGI